MNHQVNSHFWDELAIHAYRTILKKSPDCTIAHKNLGLAYSRVGKNNKAIRSLQKALHCDKDDADTHYHLGRLYQEEGKPQEALRCFKNYKKKHKETRILSNEVPNLMDDLTKMMQESDE